MDFGDHRNSKRLSGGPAKEIDDCHTEPLESALRMISTDDSAAQGTISTEDSAGETCKTEDGDDGQGATCGPSGIEGTESDGGATIIDGKKGDTDATKVRGLSDSLSQIYLGDEDVTSATTSSSRKADQKVPGQGPRATRPGKVSVSSGKEAAFLDAKLSQKNLAAESAHSTTKPNRRKADEKAVDKGVRATKPGVMSVSSGRGAAFLGANLSQRSLGDESARKSDEKDAVRGPRATRPGIVSYSSGREAAFLDSKLSQRSLDRESAGLSTSRPDLVSYASGREAALLDAKLSQRSLDRDSAGLPTGTRACSRKVDEKLMERGPPATRPGIVSVSSGRETADTKLAKRSLDEGNFRKADAKGSSTRALRPGIVSISSGRKAAFLDTRLSQRSLGQESTDSETRVRSRKVDEKVLDTTPRATRPGIVSVSSGRDTLFENDKLSQRPTGDESVRKSDEKVDGRGPTATRPGIVSVSSSREAAFLDARLSQRSLGGESVKKRNARKADEKDIVNGPRATRPGIVSVSSGRDPSLFDEKSFQRPTENGTLRNCDEKPAARGPRTSRPGIISVSPGREAASLDAKLSQRSIGVEGTTKVNGRKVDEKAFVNGPRATRPGIVSVSSGKEAVPLVDEKSSLRPSGNDSSQNCDEKLASRGLKTNRPGIASVSPGREAASLDAKLSQRSLGVDGTTKVNGRKADEKACVGPRATRPGIVSVSSGKEAAAFLDAKVVERSQHDDGCVRKVDEKGAARGPRAIRPGIVSVSSTREAAILDAKLSQRSLGKGGFRMGGRKVDEKPSDKEPETIKPGIASLLSTRTIGLVEITRPEQTLGGNNTHSASLFGKSCNEKEPFRGKQASTPGLEIVLDTSSASYVDNPTEKDHERLELEMSSYSAQKEAAVLDRKISQRSLNGASRSAPEERNGGDKQDSRPRYVSDLSCTSFVSIPEDDVGFEIDLSEVISGLQAGAAAGQCGASESSSYYQTKPGAFTSSFSSLGGSLSDLNSDVAAKQRARPVPIHTLSESNLLEHRVASKVAQEDESALQTAQRPSFRSQLSSRFGLGGRQNSRRVLSSLDDRIANKVASFGFTRPMTMLESADQKGKDKKGSQEFSSDDSAGFRTRSPDSNFFQDEDMEYCEFGGQSEDGLAIALAVEEEEGEDAYIPSAVEFDPDAKPPIVKNRRFRLYVVLINIIAIAGILGTAIGLNIAAKKATQGIPYRETLGIRENVALALNNETLLLDPSSSFRRALDWITYDDPLQLLPNHTGFIQRYLLAKFYFSTSEKQEWGSDCAPPEDGVGGPCLFDRYNVGFGDDLTDGYYVKDRGSNWLSDVPVCRWAGIDCDEFDQVRRFRFSGLNMTGTFPTSMELFAFLQSIELRFNLFEPGPFPADLVTAKHITKIDLKSNHFTGPLPRALYESRVLYEVDLAKNSITGALEGMGSFTQLRELDISDNLLSGTLPSEIMTLTSLDLLTLNHNNLRGSIPESYFKLPNLSKLVLSNNEFTGSLPSQVSTTNLQFLLAQNNKLVGTLPDSLFDNTGLYRIKLENNALQGTISSGVSQLSELVLFSINNNLFSGTIPSELAELPLLHDLWLQKNNLEGSVPGELCPRERAIKKLAIVTTLSADCLPDEDDGSSETECSCCTRCCDSSGDYCLNSEI